MIAAIIGQILSAIPPSPMTPTQSRAVESQMPPVPDPVVAHMRPAGRLVASVNVGPGRTATTIQAGIDAAVALRATVLAVEGVPRATPMYWIEVIIDPGVYICNTILPTYCKLVGSSGDPTDVELQSVADGLAGVVVTGGAAQWIEAVTIHLQAQATFPKYPIHHTYGGTLVIANSILWTESTSYTQCIGADGGGGLVVIHDTELRTREGVSDAVFFHGPGDDPNNPNVMVLSAITFDTGDRIAYNSAWLTVGSYGEIWLIDSTGGDLSAIIGDKTTLHIAGGTWTGTPGGTVTVDDRTDWPIPIDGLSLLDHLHSYGTPA